MNDLGSIVAGYGITIVAVVSYAAWILVRGRSIGRELGIGSDITTSDDEGASPWT